MEPPAACLLPLAPVDSGVRPGPQECMPHTLREKWKRLGPQEACRRAGAGSSSTLSHHTKGLFKYMGPRVARTASSSENYEDNSSPPLRIFHLYKSKIQNIKIICPFSPSKGITVSKDSYNIQKFRNKIRSSPNRD